MALLFFAVFPLATAAARFSLVLSSLDGGGGGASAGRFAVESAIGSIAGAGYASMINDPPAPQKDYVQLPPSGPLTISVSTLLDNDTDFEGHAFTLSLPQNTTAHGGTVTLANGILTYTPPPTPDVRGDSFSYLVTDSTGAASLGTAVLFSPLAAPRLTGFQRSGTGLIVRFQALPNAIYLLQFRPALRPDSPWRDFPDALQPLVKAADPAGDFEFTIPVASAGTGYFRAADVESLRGALAVARSGARITMTLRGVPNLLYKLQFRDSLDPRIPWRDYPDPGQPLTVRAGADGFYEIAAPVSLANGFFRTVVRDQ